MLTLRYTTIHSPLSERLRQLHTPLTSVSISRATHEGRNQRRLGSWLCLREISRLKTSPSETVSVSPASRELESTVLGRLMKFMSTLYAFSRPHTVGGTVISICSISLMALQGREITSAALSSVVVALSAAVLMNVFIVGLNQIFDVRIDRINKPYLPLPSGDFSLQTAVTIVSASVVGSLAIGWMSGSLPLLATLLISMILGIAYSADIPFLRWKRNAFVAALCILSIRAVAVQMGFFFHAKYSLGAALTLTKPLLYAMGLFVYYSVVIALFKDIPDIKGDIQANVHTFTVRLGQRNVFWICIWLLTAMYSSAILIGLSSDMLMTRVLFPAGNLFSLMLLWREAQRVNLKHKQEITSFYMFVWKLFYLLYFFVPLLRFTT